MSPLRIDDCVQLGGMPAMPQDRLKHRSGEPEELSNNVTAVPSPTACRSSSKPAMNIVYDNYMLHWGSNVAAPSCGELLQSAGDSVDMLPKVTVEPVVEDSQTHLSIYISADFRERWARTSEDMQDRTAGHPPGGNTPRCRRLPRWTQDSLRPRNRRKRSRLSGLTVSSYLAKVRPQNIHLLTNICPDYNDAALARNRKPCSSQLTPHAILA